MQFPLCEKYGFDSQKRTARIEMMDLSDENIADIEKLHEKIIQPYAEQIVSEFYVVLLSYPEINKFIVQHSKVEDLKVTQTLYLKSYGINFNQAEYFEKCLQIGQVHAQIGLPLDYYQMAFRLLNDIIFNYLLKIYSSESESLLNLVKLVSNISALDMSLAIETYHNKKVNEMSSSIHALMDERQVLSKIIGRDELTKAASRARVLDFLKENISKGEKHHKQFSVAMIDLDFFKKVNDEYGHLVGDKILTGVSTRMMGALRSDDMLGRYGGEEFLLVLPSAEIKIANQIVERICKHVADEPFNIEGNQISITVSIGVADWYDGDTCESILGRADHALYKAKDQGRNRVVVEYYQNKAS